MTAKGLPERLEPMTSWRENTYAMKPLQRVRVSSYRLFYLLMPASGRRPDGVAQVRNGSSDRKVHGNFARMVPMFCAKVAEK
jgi:hypothetical protein